MARGRHRREPPRSGERWEGGARGGAGGDRFKRSRPRNESYAHHNNDHLNNRYFLVCAGAEGCRDHIEHERNWPQHISTKCHSRNVHLGRYKVGNPSFRHEMGVPGPVNLLD
eukprot:667793-Rhodomonas_salina.1